MTDKIIAITIPNWGLAMVEGTVVEWILEEGDVVIPGSEMVEIETSKIVNVVEGQHNGTLRRTIAEPGETLPVGALIGIITTDDVSEVDIDAFVAEFSASFAAAESSADLASPEPQFADVGSHRIFYVSAGPATSEATPVIFIHGYGGDADNWMFNIDVLARDRPTFAIDLPGHGRSSKPVDDGSMATLADAVAGFIEFIAADEAHLVGHSLGAAITILVAQQHPGLVKSLTLLAPAGFSGTISSDFLGQFSAANSRGELKPAMSCLFADKSLITRSLLNDTLRSLRIDGVRQALQAIEKACFAQGQQVNRYDDFLSATDISFLIIQGGKDEVIPLPEQLQATVLPGVGHMPHLEAAAEVNRQMAEHIAGSECTP